MRLGEWAVQRTQCHPKGHLLGEFAQVRCNVVFIILNFFLNHSFVQHCFNLFLGGIVFTAERLYVGWMTFHAIQTPG